MTNARKADRAEAAFWRSAVWLPAEAAGVPERPAGIGPTDPTLPIGMETPFSMAQLGAEMSACGGTPTSGFRPVAGRQGLAACDGFAGLRAPCARAGTVRRRTREGRAAQMAAAGRWSSTGYHAPRLRFPVPGPTGTGGGVEIEGGAELAARVLLDRYGVVFQRLCTREPWLPPWRELVAVYHRREARGELRGGRFVALASGEQFALSEAVGLLREVRRRAKSLELVSLSAADPLNLAGIVTPGEAVPRGSGRVLYLDGVPIASQSGREVHMSKDLDRGAAWEARKALLRRGVGASRLVVAADGITTR